jgi:hypothetical protein
MGEPPLPITPGVTITYEATADATGSINTISSSKTNFCSYLYVLFRNNNPRMWGRRANTRRTLLRPNPPTTTRMPRTPDGIPTVPYDDQGKRNPYGMAKIVARDASNNVLATAKIVLSVSDEMSCSHLPCFQQLCLCETRCRLGSVTLTPTRIRS